MKKNADIRRRYGISSNTVLNWIREYPQHFSDGALGKQGAHRIFNEHDELVFNTIDWWRNRAGERMTAAQIDEELTAKRYIMEFPQQSLLLDQAEPVAQYTRLIELQTTVELQSNEITRLNDIIKQMESTPLVERHKNELAELNRQIGRRDAKTELLEEEIERLKQEIDQLKSNAASNGNTE